MVGNPGSSKDDRKAGPGLDKGRDVCYNQFNSSNCANVCFGNVVLRTMYDQ